MRRSGLCSPPLVSARASAFRALDAKQVELADQVAEDDRAVTRHCDIDLLNSLNA